MRAPMLELESEREIHAVQLRQETALKVRALEADAGEKLQHAKKSIAANDELLRSELIKSKQLIEQVNEKVATLERAADASEQASLTQVSRESLTQVSHESRTRVSHESLTQVSHESHTSLTQVSHESHTSLTHPFIQCVTPHPSNVSHPTLYSNSPPPTFPTEQTETELHDRIAMREHQLEDAKAKHRQAAADAQLKHDDALRAAAAESERQLQAAAADAGKACAALSAQVEYYKECASKAQADAGHGKASVSKMADTHQALVRALEQKLQDAESRYKAKEEEHGRMTRKAIDAAVAAATAKQGLHVDTAHKAPTAATEQEKRRLASAEQVASSEMIRLNAELARCREELAQYRGWGKEGESATSSPSSLAQKPPSSDRETPLAQPEQTSRESAARDASAADDARREAVAVAEQAQAVAEREKAAAASAAGLVQALEGRLAQERKNSQIMKAIAEKAQEDLKDQIMLAVAAERKCWKQKLADAEDAHANKEAEHLKREEQYAARVQALVSEQYGGGAIGEQPRGLEGDEEGSMRRADQRRGDKGQAQPEEEAEVHMVDQAFLQGGKLGRRREVPEVERAAAEKHAKEQYAKDRAEDMAAMRAAKDKAGAKADGARLVRAPPAAPPSRAKQPQAVRVKQPPKPAASPASGRSHSGRAAAPQSSRSASSADSSESSSEDSSDDDSDDHDDSDDASEATSARDAPKRQSRSFQNSMD